MVFLPKEHGAYGQLAFPIVTAFIASGVSNAGILIAAAATAGFLSHEPTAVVLGYRGARARREQRAGAMRWLLVWATVFACAGLAAVMALPQNDLWSLSIPLVPAALLTFATVRGREKTWYGEIAATLAFSGVALPVCVGAGATVGTALTVAIPYALLSICGTLAVRVVILRVRGGGDSRATSTTRRAAFALAAGAVAVLGGLTAAGTAPVGLLVAAAPGLVTPTTVAAFPPPPTRLRTLGWTLVASSFLTFLAIVGTVRA